MMTEGWKRRPCRRLSLAASRAWRRASAPEAAKRAEDGPGSQVIA